MNSREKVTLSRRQVLLASLLLMAVGAVITYGWGHFRSPNSNVSLTAPTPKAEVQPTSATTKQPYQAQDEIIESFLEDEGQKVGRTLVDSKATLQRLQKFVDIMGPDDLSRLKDIVLNEKQSMDKRMLSAYMLAQVGSPKVIDLLQAIAAAPIAEKRRKPRVYEEELVVRAQAIEGLKKFAKTGEQRSKLKEWMPVLEESFLAQRMQLILSE